MNITVVTTASDWLGGVLAHTYQEAGGPQPRAIVVVPDFQAQNHVTSAVIAWKIVGVRGGSRLLRARFGWADAKDRAIGMSLRWPKAMGGDLLVLPSPSDRAALRSTVAATDPDLLVSIGAPVIFGPTTLKLARLGAINVHNGLLPRYRGHFGTFWEVYHHERWAYVCVHEMAERVDSGRLLGWDRVAVSESPSFLELLIAKKRLGGALLARIVKDTVTDAALPETCNLDESTPSAYFGMPRLRHLMRMPALSDCHGGTVVTPSC